MTETVIERNVNQEQVSRLQELALKYIEAIEETKRAIKEANEMAKDSLTNDLAYLDAAEKAKDAAKKKDVEKKRIQSRPDMVGIATKVKGLKEKLKEDKESLSIYLIEFERLSGANVIETPKGEQLSIFKTAEARKLPSR